jgi:hypothetical protein
MEGITPAEGFLFYFYIQKAMRHRHSQKYFSPGDDYRYTIPAEPTEAPNPKILKTSSLIKKAFRENDTTPTLIRDIPTTCKIQTDYGPETVSTEPINVKFNSVNVFIGKKEQAKQFAR